MGQSYHSAYMHRERSGPAVGYDLSIVLADIGNTAALSDVHYESKGNANACAGGAIADCRN